MSKRRKRPVLILSNQELENQFWSDIEEEFGQEIRYSNVPSRTSPYFADRLSDADPEDVSRYSIARQVYCALTDNSWRYAPSGDIYRGLSFRGTASQIAGIRGRGDYLDWFCCGPEGTVTTEIESRLSCRGWVLIKPRNRQ